MGKGNGWTDVYCFQETNIFFWSDELDLGPAERDIIATRNNNFDSMFYANAHNTKCQHNKTRTHDKINDLFHTQNKNLGLGKKTGLSQTLRDRIFNDIILIGVREVSERFGWHLFR